MPPKGLKKKMKILQVEELDSDNEHCEQGGNIFDDAWDGIKEGASWVDNNVIRNPIVKTVGKLALPIAATAMNSVVPMSGTVLQALAGNVARLEHHMGLKPMTAQERNLYNSHPTTQRIMHHLNAGEYKIAGKVKKQKRAMGFIGTTANSRPPVQRRMTPYDLV